MTAKISVIIPTLNAGDSLPACLTALIEGLTAGLIKVMLITDGGPGNKTILIADDAGAHLVTGPASRGGQLRRGAAVARGQWLMVLHADTVLEPGWSRAVGDHLNDSDRAAYFRLKFRATGIMPTWVAGWANLRSALFGLPYGDQGLLVPRAAYVRAGGYPDQPLMEDVALVRALTRTSGDRPVALPATAVTGPERYQRAGWLRRGARNLWTLLRYMRGTDPERLAAAYRR